MGSTRVVAITGASAGIGRATALRLARDGCSVAVSARRGDRLELLATEIAAAGGQALPLVADVTRETDMQLLVERTVAHFGRLDVMMCNAGFGIAGTVDIGADAMHRLMDVNYFGTFYAARAAAPIFLQQRRGHLIIVSSIVGRRGVPTMGGYSATKFAQVGLAECLRAELAGSGVHVSVVFPISTDTEFHQVLARESPSAGRTRWPRQPVEAVAEAIARAIERSAPEVYPYWKSRGLVWLNAVAPGFTDRFMRKFSREPIA